MEEPAGMPAKRRSLSIRVDADLLERLKVLVADLEPDYRGFRLSVSDAVRLALLEGVAVLEANHRHRKARPK